MRRLPMLSRVIELGGEGCSASSFKGRKGYVEEFTWFSGLRHSLRAEQWLERVRALSCSRLAAGLSGLTNRFAFGMCALSTMD